MTMTMMIIIFSIPLKHLNQIPIANAFVLNGLNFNVEKIVTFLSSHVDNHCNST